MYLWLSYDLMTQHYSAASWFISLQKVMSSGRTGCCWQPCSVGVLCPAGGILDGWWEQGHCHCRQRGGTEDRKGWLCVLAALFALWAERGGCLQHPWEQSTYPSLLSTHFQPNTVPSCPPSLLCPVSVPPQPEEWGTQELLCCRAPVAPLAPLH